MTKTTALFLLHARTRWYRAKNIALMAWTMGCMLQAFHRTVWRQFAGAARQIWRGGT